ncbi:hypothetical protein BCR39DRAFT_445844, partial [Naematelia encephala]
SRSELLFLGKECHHPACHLHDFLPFSCPACHESFCQPHFLPSQHSCTAPLPASMIDRIAPTCPMCNTVVPTPKSGEPNDAVERHIMSGCPGMEGGEAARRAELRRKKDAGQICWRKGCNKTLVVPMKCESCRHVFCPTHRHTTSHTCTPIASGSNTPLNLNASSRPTAKSGLSRLLPPSMQPPSQSTKPVQAPNPPSQPQPQPQPIPISTNNSTPLDAKAAAAAAALRRAGQDVKVPFIKSKTDKRAADEHASALKALQARHQKGLLTKAEEVRFARL